MREETITCDECGERKGESNRAWFIAYVTWADGALHKGTFSMFHFGGLAKSYDEMSDLCGETCAGKAFHRWLATGSAKKQTEVPTDGRPMLDVARELIGERRVS